MARAIDIKNKKIFKKRRKNMKNRKTIIVAFVLVACMLIGVGFAALSTVLDITGTVNITKEFIDDEFANDVYFVSGAFVGGKFDVDSGKASQDSINPESNGHAASASFTSNNMAAKGDFVEVKFTIKNDSDFDVAVTIDMNKANGNANMSNTNASQFKFQIKYGESGTYMDLADINLEELAIASGGEGYVYVKVTVEDEINAATNAIFGVELVATEVTP